MIKIVIPAFNEQNAIGLVIDEIPVGLATEIIVVDNGSTDNTCEIAAQKGATVIKEANKGYGRACLAGLDHIASQNNDLPDTVVFLDGDHSDYPENMEALTQPISEGFADLVIGSRALGHRENGAMTIQQVFGNWLATWLIKKLYGTKFTDLGPFRAIRYDALLQINMQDTSYGWTVEMQAKAAKLNLRCLEVPVDYRVRIGTSKISGTLKGTLLAGYKIITTIFKYR